MTISASDLQLFLSGGQNNSSTNNSIGGDISNFSISENLNNLFPNITTEEALNGKTDYRCFYLKNVSQTDSVNDVKVSISEQGSLGSFANIGVEKNNETQKIEILGPVTHGLVVFEFNGHSFTADWNNNFSEAIISGLETGGAKNAEISSSSVSETYVYTITFKGESSNRFQSLIKINQNILANTPNSPITISVIKTKDMYGKPLNYSPDKLAVDYQAPSGVSFVGETENIEIGTLGPNDFFPIWIKRQTPSGTEYQSDFFKFKISGKPFI